MTTISLYNGEVNIDFDPVKHMYRWREKDLPVRGVTTVLRVLNKPALLPWAAKMCGEHFNKGVIPMVKRWISAGHFSMDINDEWDEEQMQRDLDALDKEARAAHRKFASDAADIGTLVHKWCEQYMEPERSGMELPPEGPARQSCLAFVEWFDQNNVEPMALEQIVFSREHYFAGTVDFYGHINGELVCMDLKTSSGLYPEMVLQVNGGYPLALEEMYGNKLDASWIVRLDKKTGKFQTYRMNRSDDDQLAFRALLAVDRHMKRVEAKVKEMR